ncbi:MAG TPA: HEPN domain-containing protein [Anaerolineales bacterium]|nr:HEPN domain-containing protein [Anaerolineales bacterium]
MAGHSSEIASNLERAETNLKAARDLLERDYYDIAASRAYYSAFHAASALLLNADMDTSKHSGVIALIHQHFVKTGQLAQEQGRNLNWLFELRNVGDYGVSIHVASEDADRAVQVAERFLESAKHILGKQ